MTTMPENRLDRAPRCAEQRVMTTLMQDTAHEKRAITGEDLYVSGGLR